jgi:hypothetical protein
MIYFFGSLYIISALFRFSYSYSKLLIKNNKYIEKDKLKRVDEIIYSSIHSILIILLSSYSLKDNIFSLDFSKQIPLPCESTKLTLLFSLSYFTLDLFKCIINLDYIYILHHICAINLLLFSVVSLNERNYESSFVLAYLLLLEVNTPLMNLGSILKLLKFDYNVYGVVWVLHLISYILCRLIMVPYITYYYYYYNDINYYQLPHLLIIYFGSFYWAFKQIKGINYMVLNKINNKII